MHEPPPTGLEKRGRDAITAKAAREADPVVGIWNARHAANRDLWFYPIIGAEIDIGAEIAAETPSLRSNLTNLPQAGQLIRASLIALMARRSKA
jgi:hypothetical protein